MHHVEVIYSTVPCECHTLLHHVKVIYSIVPCEEHLLYCTNIKALKRHVCEGDTLLRKSHTLLRHVKVILYCAM